MSPPNKPATMRDADDDIRGLPLSERRARLEARIGARTWDTLRISEQVADDGRALHERALGEGWEGLIVKEAHAPYQSGRRSPTWRKLKVVHEQEFVIGGWTEPRQTRQYFGALLLGVHDPKTGALISRIGAITEGFCNSHAKAICAGGTPALPATFSSASITRRSASLTSSPYS